MNHKFILSPFTLVSPFAPRDVRVFNLKGGLVDIESMNEMPWCDHSNETSLVALSHGLLVPYYVFSHFTTRNLKVLNFNFGYHILGCKC